MTEKKWKTIHRFYAAFLVLSFFFFVIPLFLPVFTGPDSSAPKMQNDFRPTPAKPEATGNRLTGETEYTLDASDKENFVYFDFSRSSIVKATGSSPLEWDMAFRRTKILTNSGASSPKGKGGVAVIHSKEFKEILSLPEAIKFETDHVVKGKALPENRILMDWYKYDFMQHRLAPSPAVYVIRTADGKYAKVQIVSYYCGSKPGCYTFRYVYQGNGGKNFQEKSEN